MEKSTNSQGKYKSKIVEGLVTEAMLHTPAFENSDNMTSHPALFTLSVDEDIYL